MKHTTLLILCVLLSLSINAQDCDCDHVIEPNEIGQIFYANDNNVQPGDVICMMAGTYNQYMAFIDLEGTVDEPIIIKNCGGQVVMKATTTGIDAQNSQNFIITGTGSREHFYGIRIEDGYDGIRLNNFSNNYQVDHVEVDGASNHGMDLKNDPRCSDPRTWRDANLPNEFVVVHDTRVVNIGLEGFYIGDSHYHSAVPCVGGGTVTVEEAAILRAEIYNNIVINTGNDGIQVGSVIEEALIYDNVVRDYGATDQTGQHRSAFQINPGTKGVLYNNLAFDGPGSAFFILGDGVEMYNNLIVNAKTGVESYERLTTNDSRYRIYNNTFVDMTESGIAIIAPEFTRGDNIFVNNIVHVQSSGDFYGYSTSAAWEASNDHNNIYTNDIGSLNFVDPDNEDYRLSSNSSEALDNGDCSSNNDVSTDAMGFTRSFGSSCDIGAFEYTEASLAVSESSLDFGEFNTLDATADVQSYVLEGEHLRSEVKIPTPRSFKLSLSETDFPVVDTLVIDYEELRSLDVTIYVQFDPAEIGEISDEVLHISEEVSSPAFVLNAVVDVLDADKDISVNEVNVFPNPVDSSSKLNIKLNRNPAGPISMVLIDASGKEVLTYATQQMEFSVDLPLSIENGLYFVKVGIGGDKEEVKRIYISR